MKNLNNLKDLDEASEKLLEGRIETDNENVFVQFYTKTPLLSEDNWDCAVIVELSQDKKFGRANLIKENGELMGSLIYTDSRSIAKIHGGDYIYRYKVLQKELNKHLDFEALSKIEIHVVSSYSLPA
ncbi:MAG: hypothetical protein Q8L29_04525 [archaeon]|nr:hypothetical protein [archaeon]